LSRASQIKFSILCTYCKQTIFSLNVFFFFFGRRACAYLVQQLEPLESREDRDQWLDKIVDYVRVSNTNDGNIVTYELLSKALKVSFQDYQL